MKRIDFSLQRNIDSYQPEYYPDFRKVEINEKECWEFIEGSLRESLNQFESENRLPKMEVDPFSVLDSSIFLFQFEIMDHKFWRGFNKSIIKGGFREIKEPLFRGPFFPECKVNVVEKVMKKIKTSGAVSRIARECLKKERGKFLMKVEHQPPNSPYDEVFLTYQED